MPVVHRCRHAMGTVFARTIDLPRPLTDTVVPATHGKQGFPPERTESTENGVRRSVYSVFSCKKRCSRSAAGNGSADPAGRMVRRRGCLDRDRPPGLAHSTVMASRLCSWRSLGAAARLRLCRRAPLLPLGEVPPCFDSNATKGNMKTTFHPSGWWLIKGRFWHTLKTVLNHATPTARTINKRPRRRITTVFFEMP